MKKTICPKCNKPAIQVLNSGSRLFYVHKQVREPNPLHGLHPMHPEYRTRVTQKCIMSLN